jgi:uncharacterized membrane protein
MLAVLTGKKPYQQRIKLSSSFLCFCFFFLFLGMYGLARPGNNGHKGPAFTARLMNIEAAANTTFTYNATLRNNSSVARTYDLTARVPMGWSVAFKTEGSQVSSLNIDSGRTQDITIEINPPSVAKPAKYTIPVVAVSGSDSLLLNLEAVVKGTYGVQLTTINGRLSDEVTEGSHKQIHLVVKNTGTIALDNLDLSAQAPPQWDASFEPSKIVRLEPGNSADVTATLNVPGKTIAGDYVTTLSVKNLNTSSDASFRMTVRTSVLTGWLGILVILLALWVVYYLIRKYGRR